LSAEQAAEQAAGQAAGQAAPAAGQAAQAVHRVFGLIAKRLELRHRAKEHAAAERRRTVQAHTGKSIQEVAACLMQRQVRQFLRGLFRTKIAARQRFIDAAFF